MKNDSYYAADEVQIDRVSYRSSADQNTEVALYESGARRGGEGPGSLPIEELTRIRADATR